MDDTWVPQVVFAEDAGGAPNRRPGAGLQCFGHGRTGAPHRRPDATGLNRKGAPPKAAPSVRTDEAEGSALRELEAAAGLRPAVLLALARTRGAERRVGQSCVRMCGSRRPPYL